MRTIRRVAAVVMLLVVSSAIAGEKSLKTAELGNVLYCLQTKVAKIGYAPPRFAPRTLRLRYAVDGDKGSASHQPLNLVVYGPDEKKAILYQIYLEETKGQPSIEIGEMGTLKLENGRMEPDEIWGGVATYNKVQDILKKVSSTPVLSVPEDEVKAGPGVCLYKR